ncbi:hypothetical protein CDD82_7154 [Ophiocordyceps australis]|uniref:Uncharacterized protein n=1 Tax=Ophiocordyceps australis TaxID=1399860 RepID=A0A2C5YSA8_9HYPO|nr:hypothetical protein CDD82_7154 [Ophiocordyceps australis]
MVYPSNGRAPGTVDFRAASAFLERDREILPDPATTSPSSSGTADVGARLATFGPSPELCVDESYSDEDEEDLEGLSSLFAHKCDLGHSSSDGRVVDRATLH